jgi:hypothetical protein
MLLAQIKQNQIGLKELGNEPGTDGTFPRFFDEWKLVNVSSDSGFSALGIGYVYLRTLSLVCDQ